jgi:hypothetical protein
MSHEFLQDEEEECQMEIRLHSETEVGYMWLNLKDIFFYNLFLKIEC